MRSNATYDNANTMTPQCKHYLSHQPTCFIYNQHQPLKNPHWSDSTALFASLNELRWSTCYNTTLKENFSCSMSQSKLYCQEGAKECKRWKMCPSDIVSFTVSLSSNAFRISSQHEVVPCSCKRRASAAGPGLTTAGLIIITSCDLIFGSAGKKSTKYVTYMLRFKTMLL